MAALPREAMIPGATAPPMIGSASTPTTSSTSSSPRAISSLRPRRLRRGPLSFVDRLALLTGSSLGVAWTHGGLFAGV
jgi:hypothetical protein